MMVNEIFKILSDTNRLRILNLLYGRELCVCELEYLLEISQSNISKHLRVMTTMGILDQRRDNKFNYYSVKKEIMEKHLFLKSVFEEEFPKDEVLKEEFNLFLDYEIKKKENENFMLLIKGKVNGEEIDGC